MPRPTHPPLTDRAILAQAPGRTPRDIRDGELRGLVLSVLPSGLRQWCVRYRTQGKQRRLVLGSYPGMGIAAARKAARRAMSDLDGGRDLVAERNQARAVKTDTIEALTKEYLVLHAWKQKRSAASDERMLKVYVLPYWKTRSVREITRRDVRALIERLAQRAPIMANRVLELVRKMFNFGIGRDWLDGNPASRIEKPGIEKARDRVLTDDEIRKLWNLLSHFPASEHKQAPGRKRARGSGDGPFCPISPVLAAVQKLRLVTAQRGGEVLRLRWSDLDLVTGWWTIPAGDSKNGQPHRVPLSRLAIKIIEGQRREQDLGTPETSPTHDNVFTGREGALVVDRAKKASAALSRVLGFEFWSHDLRRTAATRMAAAGVPRDHIARVLSHVEGGPKSTRIYDRYDYDREKRFALETWSRMLARILSGEARDSVKPLTRRRSVLWESGVGGAPAASRLRGERRAPEASAAQTGSHLVARASRTN
jgi:integrase